MNHGPGAQRDDGVAPDVADRPMADRPAARPPLPVLGQPPGDADPNGDPDFSREHEETAVADDIITGADHDREPEAPRGWSGMQR